ncbi:serine/threonine-protein kinase Nek4 [Labeo rohita]|uniref:serine/threonine-protein kinase Nek4 n=1 Tax=Labeo rohita TaxID=84645 RepID=UPI0021E2B797|nr:serine/threonine-protein kinase Nek4 [Labeo rohita]
MSNSDHSEQNAHQRNDDERSRVLREHGFTMKKELEPGKSGRAFLVTNTEGDLCVVKEISYRDENNFSTVKEEVEMLKTLVHGYIVTYEDSFEDEEAGLFYVVMEHCTGADFYQRMQIQIEKGIFEEQQIIDWLVQICLALQYLSDNNVLHRDINPQNIFLTENGYINLGVFGCSKKIERYNAYKKPVVVADLYVSPDVLSKGCKSDIWSLGWLLHDLCMLDVWSNNLERHYLHALSLKGTTPQISERYSEELRELNREMLSRDPKDRPSADEILAKPFLKDAVKRNKGIPEALEQSLKKAIKSFNKAYSEHYKDFEILVSDWEKTIDSLESVHYSATAGSLSGAVIGAAGGITALVGVALAPFTFGASLIVTGIGVGVGVAGGVTGAASNITNTVKQKSFRESLEQIEQKYRNVSEPILSSLNTLRRVLRKIFKFSIFVRGSTLDNIQTAWKVSRSTADCATGLVSLGMLANVGRIAVQAAKIGRAAAAVSGVLSGLLVIADVAFIVKDSREIHEMRQQWKTDDPEKVSSSVLKSIAQMRKTHKDLCNILKEIKETREELNDYIKLTRGDRD